MYEARKVVNRNGTNYNPRNIKVLQLERLFKRALPFDMEHGQLLDSVNVHRNVAIGSDSDSNHIFSNGG